MPSLRPRVTAANPRGLPATLPGWRVVAGAFLVCLAGWGAIYAYAAVAPALAVAAGVPDASVSLVYAIAAGSCFLAGALAGPVADRCGPRRPAIAGMLAVGLGLVLATQATSLTGLCLTFGLLTGGGAGLAYIPAMAAVQCWFVARRGLASGLAAMGIGVATILVPPVAAALAPLGDWRVQLGLLGTALTAIGLLGAALLAAPSKAHGPAPDGAACTAHVVPEGLPFAAVRRSPDFARLYLAVMLVSVPAALPFAHLAPFAEEAGLTRADALALVGLIGVGSILGRVALGFIADLLGRQATLLGCCIGVCLASLAWAVAGPAALAPFAVAFGAFQGGFVALSSSVVVDLFGRRTAARTSGLLLTGRGIAVLAGAPAFAEAAARIGYGAPIAFAALSGALGCVLLWQVGRGETTVGQPACAWWAQPRPDRTPRRDGAPRCPAALPGAPGRARHELFGTV